MNEEVLVVLITTKLLYKFDNKLERNWATRWTYKSHITSKQTKQLLTVEKKKNWSGMVILENWMQEIIEESNEIDADRN